MTLKTTPTMTTICPWPLTPRAAVISLAALVTTVPALAEDTGRALRTTPIAQHQIAQAMSPGPHHTQPAPDAATPQLTEEDKKRIEQLKQRRLQRDGGAAAPPPATPPAAATAPPPPPQPSAQQPVQPPVAQPTVQPRLVNPTEAPETSPAGSGDGRRRDRRPTVDTPAAQPMPAPTQRAADPAPPPPAHRAPAEHAAPSAPPPHTAPVATPPPAATPPLRDARTPRNLDDAKSGRTENAVSGGRTVIQESDRRTIIRHGDQVIIQKDEAAQMQRVAPGARMSRDAAGTNTAVVERPDNSKIITETDRSGQLLRRYRRDGAGRETQIIDNRSRRKDNLGRDIAIGAGIVAGAAILNSVVNAPPPRVRIPRDKYIVRYEDASEDDVYEALSAPPVDTIERRYTLDEVRATPTLRDRMRRIDLDDINFEFGSWDVNPSEYGKLERIARAMNRVVRRNPNEVFLIEGYTDAVGSDVDNLTLSDRRAEAVSVILSEQFNVPFENLTTQGYGEQYLKVDTDGPERANRRVAVRRITPLISQDVAVAEPPPPPRPRAERRWRDDRDRYEDRTDRYRRWKREQRRYRDY